MAFSNTVSPAGPATVDIRRLVEVECIQASGLFDGAFYLRANPDVASAGVDPLRHFIEHGAREGRNPHPLFDTIDYRSQEPHLDSEVNPLIHFITIGAFEGRRPNWLFDPDFYFRKYPDVMASGLNPLRHFILHGADEGRQPHPLFDTRYYRSRYPDVASANINPLHHFLTSGATDGRSPCPLFDPEFYLQQCANDSLAQANPLWHFVHCGAAAGLKPHTLFDTAYYQAQNKVPHTIDALSYFLDRGATTRPNPYFDGAFYWHAYPDVAIQKINPLVHFVTEGAREGRWPNPLFNPVAYLARYPDALETHRSTLEHFVDSQTGPAVSVIPQPFKQSGIPGRFKRRSLAPLSVIIPAENDDTSLVATLHACRQRATGCEVEFIVLSEKPTPEIQAIPNVRWEQAVGRAAARNLGLRMTTYEVILFLEDDLVPLDEHFFHVHASLHASNPETNFAVRGNVLWPDGDHPGEHWELSHIMSVGSDTELPPRRFVSNRYFSLSNISLKKSLVMDLKEDALGSDLPTNLLNGIDLASRLSAGDNPLRLFYDPSATASRRRPRTLSELLDDQFDAGRALKALTDRLPLIADEFDLHPLLTTLSSRECRLNSAVTIDYTALIGGFKAWARTMNTTTRLRSAKFINVLAALFELCRFAGFVSCYTTHDVSSAYRYMVSRFTRQLRKVLQEDAIRSLSLLAESGGQTRKPASDAAHG